MYLKYYNKFFNLTVLTLVVQLSSVITHAEQLSQQSIIINPASLSQQPVIDGKLSEWEGDGWNKLALKPAMDKDPNEISAITVELKTAVVDDVFYMAARWPDVKANIEYKPWIWIMNKYRRDKKMDDMFALRFDMSGDYNQCMLSKSNYSVDVWLWSSGRSNLTAYAEDMVHTISTRMIENAAEYEYINKDGPPSIIYIKKKKDKGIAPYANVRINRKKQAGKKIASIKVTDNPSGSIIDVKAKGQWSDGFWHLEMARKLSSNNSDDVNLAARDNIKGAIAVFNHNSSEHKAKSKTLLFNLKP